MKDFLRALAAKGDRSWLEAYEGASMDNKRQIMSRLQMCLDAAGLMVSSKDTSGTRVESGTTRGWMALWDVAKLEGVPFDPAYQTILMDLVADDKSRPRSKPRLAANGLG